MFIYDNLSKCWYLSRLYTFFYVGAIFLSFLPVPMIPRHVSLSDAVCLMFLKIVLIFGVEFRTLNIIQTETIY